MRVTDAAIAILLRIIADQERRVAEAERLAAEPAPLRVVVEPRSEPRRERIARTVNA